jgi:hypothetical protein
MKGYQELLLFTLRGKPFVSLNPTVNSEISPLFNPCTPGLQSQYQSSYKMMEFDTITLTLI